MEYEVVVSNKHGGRVVLAAGFDRPYLEAIAARNRKAHVYAGAKISVVEVKPFPAAAPPSSGGPRQATRNSCGREPY